MFMAKAGSKYVSPEQKKILKVVVDQYPGYYLTGGTALALYFGHRRSEDLDFFTQQYKRNVPPKIMEYISQKTGFGHGLIGEVHDPQLVPMQSHIVKVKSGGEVKVDFVLDSFRNINKIKNGLHSVEDIYFRKIGIAVGGGRTVFNEAGREVSMGRQRAKDIYDLYYLSNHYEDFPSFFKRHFRPGHIERLSSWYRSFNRLEIATNLIDLATKEKVDARNILKYLDQKILIELEHGEMN